MVWPVLYLIATAFVVIVPMIASPIETGYGLLMILTSIPVYFVMIAWKSKPKAFQRAMGEYSRCAFSRLTLTQSINSRSFYTKIAKIIDGGSA